MRQKTSTTLPLLLLLVTTTATSFAASGEEPPGTDVERLDDAVDEGVLLIMGENSTFLNGNETVYEAPREAVEFNLLDTYLPLFIFVLDLPLKDREALQSYLTAKTYEKLKYDIDSRVRMQQRRGDEESVLARINASLVNSIDSVDQFDEITVDVVRGYHNASVYNAIRSVWLKQLRPFLPLIDQMAIMQYFAQRKVSEYERMSIWARIWENLNAWMYGKKQANECYATEPKCVRTALEQLSFEQRISLDAASYENKFDSVDGIIREKLEESRKGTELDEWLLRNQPPQALEAILDERSDIEEQALQRLRDNGVLSSLKHYYKAVIETRSSEEQDEIRKFFDVMNDTFARCFDPLRGQFHDF